MPLALRPVDHFLRHVFRGIHLRRLLVTIGMLQLIFSHNSHDLTVYETVDRGICFRYEVMYYGVFYTVRYGDMLA